MPTGNLTQISVIVVNYNSGDLLKACLFSISRSPVVKEIIVVDNCSIDHSSDVIAEDQNLNGVKLVRNPQNLGLLGGSVGGVLLAWLGIQRMFLDVPLANKSILYLAILLIIVGFQLVTFGLLAELQSRSYHESSGKPIYVIRKIV